MYNIVQQPIFPFDYRAEIEDPKLRIAFEKLYTITDELVAKFNMNVRDIENNLSRFGPTQTLLATDRVEHISDTYEVIAKDPSAGITLTSVPTISDGYAGQRLLLIGTDDTRTVTLQDEANLAGSNLNLGGYNFKLSKGTTLYLVYSETVGAWLKEDYCLVNPYYYMRSFVSQTIQTIGRWYAEPDGSGGYDKYLALKQAALSFTDASWNTKCVMYVGGTDIGFWRCYSQDYTILDIWATKTLAQDSEATLSLVRGAEPNQELMDIYNNGYVASAGEVQHGIRILKAGAGSLRDFVFDFDDGTKHESFRVEATTRDLVMSRGIRPAHLADASATNDSIYYSTTAGKLVYKDSGGSVNALY